MARNSATARNWSASTVSRIDWIIVTDIKELVLSLGDVVGMEEDGILTENLENVPGKTVSTTVDLCL